MGLFHRLFSKQEDSNESLSESAGSFTHLELLFPVLPDFNRALISFRQSLKDPNIHFERSDGSLAGHFTFMGHTVLVEGFETALPRDVQQRTIGHSNHAQSIKDPMYQHRAHIRCSHTDGPDEVQEKLLALYHVAAAFVPLGLLGVVDQVAFTAQPPAVVQQVSQQLTRHDLKKRFPTDMWTNLLKVPRPDGLIWYVSRGFERFHSPNFALLAQPRQASDVLEVFTELLKQVVYDKAKYSLEDTIHLSGMDLQFKAPYEFEEELQGAGRLLVVEIDA